MARELGGSQISALLESVPGIANVLRSPVADALVGMIRAGAGIGEFDPDQAKELVQYAVRRGLIHPREGDELLSVSRRIRVTSSGGIASGSEAGRQEVRLGQADRSQACREVAEEAP